MKIKYFPETDSLCIDVKDVPIIESEEIAEGIIVDYDENNQIVGIEILDLSKRNTINLPFECEIKILLTKKLKGLLKNTEASEEDFYEYLEEKHLRGFKND